MIATDSQLKDLASGLVSLRQHCAREGKTVVGLFEGFIKDAEASFDVRDNFLELEERLQALGLPPEVWLNKEELRAVAALCEVVADRLQQLVRLLRENARDA